jgi:hypothetical protein
MLVRAPFDLLHSASLCSFCSSVLTYQVVFSGDLTCYIRAHACSFAFIALCCFASLVHVALAVFCMSVLRL